MDSLEDATENGIVEISSVRLVEWRIDESDRAVRLVGVLGDDGQANSLGHVIHQEGIVDNGGAKHACVGDLFCTAIGHVIVSVAPGGIVQEECACSTVRGTVEKHPAIEWDKSHVRVGSNTLVIIMDDSSRFRAIDVESGRREIRSARARTAGETERDRILSSVAVHDVSEPWRQDVLVACIP